MDESWEIELKNSIKKTVSKIHQATKLLKRDISRNELPSKGKTYRIGSVDGGSQSYDFTAVSVIFVQASGTVFIQEMRPEWHELKKIHLSSATSNLSRYKAIYRDILEIKVARALLKDDPEIILLDGVHGSYFSRGFPETIWQRLRDQNGEIYPHQPGFDFLEAYDHFFLEYSKLIDSCLKKDILLLGVAKDSRYKRLVDSFDIPNVIGITDPVLVKWNYGGKTGYTDPFPTKPFIDNISQMRWRKLKITNIKANPFTSYFQISSKSIPFRVDILAEQVNRIEEIAEIIVTYHDGNGFLLPPHFAHKQAHTQRGETMHWANLVRELVLEDLPEYYDLFFGMKRRDLF